jgi:hypothetical protein
MQKQRFFSGGFTRETAFNYCYIPGYNDESLTTKDAMQTYLNSLGLDGIELFHYRKIWMSFQCQFFQLWGALKYWHTG